MYELENNLEECRQVAYKDDAPANNNAKVSGSSISDVVNPIKKIVYEVKNHGYVLKEKDTGEILTYGESINPDSYNKKDLGSINLANVIDTGVSGYMSLQSYKAFNKSSATYKEMKNTTTLYRAIDDQEYKQLINEKKFSLGLQYLRYRYYDSNDGRFNTIDNYLGTITSPLSQNRYAYTNNNPISYIDPSGHRMILNNMVMMSDGGGGSRKSAPKPNPARTLGAVGVMAGIVGQSRTFSNAISYSATNALKTAVSRAKYGINKSSNTGNPLVVGSTYGLVKTTSNGRAVTSALARSVKKLCSSTTARSTKQSTQEKSLLQNVLTGGWGVLKIAGGLAASYASGGGGITGLLNAGKTALSGAISYFSARASGKNVYESLNAAGTSTLISGISSSILGKGLSNGITAVDTKLYQSFGSAAKVTKVISGVTTVYSGIRTVTSGVNTVKSAIDTFSSFGDKNVSTSQKVLNVLNTINNAYLTYSSASATMNSFKIYNYANNQVKAENLTTSNKANAIGKNAEEYISKEEGIEKNTTTKSINSRDRIIDFKQEDDGHTRYIESKNVSSLSYTKQIRDFVDMVKKDNTANYLELYVRPTTKLSQPLQNAIDCGDIVLKYLPC